jgi:hypothetical protein
MPIVILPVWLDFDAAGAERAEGAGVARFVLFFRSSVGDSVYDTYKKEGPAEHAAPGRIGPYPGNGTDLDARRASGRIRS